MTETVVLAYSGGLDTSVAVPWLRETRGCDVVTLTVDVGAGAAAESVLQRALAGGAKRALAVDARQAFVTDYVWPVLQAGSLYQGVYPLVATPVPSGQSAAGTAPSAGGSYYLLSTSAANRTIIGELDTDGCTVTYTGARLYIVRLE